MSEIVIIVVIIMMIDDGRYSEPKRERVRSDSARIDEYYLSRNVIRLKMLERCGHVMFHPKEQACGGAIYICETI